MLHKYAVYIRLGPKKFISNRLSCQLAKLLLAQSTKHVCVKLYKVFHKVHSNYRTDIMDLSYNTSDTLTVLSGCTEFGTNLVKNLVEAHRLSRLCSLICKSRSLQTGVDHRQVQTLKLRQGTRLDITVLN